MKMLLIILMIAPMVANAQGLAQGYLNFKREQLVRDCVTTCQNDGYCQAACIATREPQPIQRYVYQPMRQPQLDPICMSTLFNGEKLPRAQAQAMCTK